LLVKTDEQYLRNLKKWQIGKDLADGFALKINILTAQFECFL